MSLRTVYRSAFTPAISLFSALVLVAGIGVISQADARLDKGAFELSQSGNTASAWYWVPNSTSDGSGTQYLAFTSAFDPGGPAHPSIDAELTFVSSGTFSDLQAFADWIVANNTHVSATHELTFHKMEVTTVQP